MHNIHLLLDKIVIDIWNAYIAYHINIMYIYVRPVSM